MAIHQYSTLVDEMHRGKQELSQGGVIRVRMEIGAGKCYLWVTGCQVDYIGGRDQNDNVLYNPFLLIINMILCLKCHFIIKVLSNLNYR
jgi:hypothetical protein